jgi:hypothetical protein
MARVVDWGKANHAEGFREHYGHTRMNRRLKTTQWILAVVALAVLSVVIVVALDAYLFSGVRLYGPVKGLFYRTFRAPAIVQAGFVEELNPEQPEAQLEKFLSTYRSHQGSCGLRRTVVSVEGTPVSKCLVTESGTLTLVIDFTRDRNSTRDFVVVHPSSLWLHPLEPDSDRPAAGPHPSRTYMNCMVQGRPVAF